VGDPGRGFRRDLKDSCVSELIVRFVRNIRILVCEGVGRIGCSRCLVELSNSTGGSDEMLEVVLMLLDHVVEEVVVL
jgi:hypothetical protein